MGRDTSGQPLMSCGW